MTRGLTRPDLDSIPAYVPGGSAPGAVKLASNEVPYGPLPGVVEAVNEAITNSHRYPDMGVVALRDALAGYLADEFGLTIAPERIVTGCGSVALVEHLVRVCCVPGDEVVYPWRSFEAYPIAVAASAATSVRVPNTPDHGHDLAGMLAAITDRTRLVIVCNPNNPTGTAVRKPDLDAFLDAVPQDVLVVLDEAYREFITDPSVPDGIATYGDRPNVAVLRTLSKAWGLAGLRLGYLVAAPGVANTVRKIVTPFSASVVAQAAGLAALRAVDEMKRRARLIVEERDRVFTAVRKHYPEVPESQANFVWLPLGDGAAEFAARCATSNVIVRAFQGDGVRVSIGTPEENDAFLSTLG